MSTHIHNLIILPGNDVQFFCKDGMSPATVYNINKIYKLGGELKFVNCGAGNIYAGLEQAYGDMTVKYSEELKKEETHNGHKWLKSSYLRDLGTA